MSGIDWNTWGPPVVVLLLAAVAAVVAAMRVQTGTDSRALEARTGLLSQKESLLEQLREHDGDRNKMDDAAWAERRERLLARASGVLRQLEEAPETATEVSSEVPAEATGRGLTVTWVVGLLLFCGVAAGLVSQFARPRPDDNNAATASAADAFSADVAHAEAALRQDPDDMDALNLLAHVAIERKDLPTAMSVIDKAKGVDADDLELRIHVDALRLLVGMGAKAEASLKVILEEDPAQSEAMRWLSYARFQQGDTQGAVEWLEAATQAGSETDRAIAAAWLQQLRSSQASQGTATPQAQTSSPAAVPEIEGLVQLADGASTPAGGRLFVLARATEAERGPPLAAVRLGTPALPADFALGVADLIRGGAWPEEVWLKARWSAGGDPMTAGPGDLASALLGPVTAGTTDVALVLEAME